MEALVNLLSWQVVASSIVVYFASLAIYRLTLHPLSRFPGPKLAAVTRYYEAYYDVLQNGQYTFHIEQLHKQYGPIIRISPYELHVNDAAFFDQLYRQDGRWDKYAWTINGWSSPGASIFTADHYYHKARRQPLGPFFSKAKVASQQHLVWQHVLKLCDRLSDHAAAGSKVDLGAATTAVARDVSYDFIIGKDYDSLGCDDFDASMVAVSQGSGAMWRIGKHISWFTPLIKSIPVSIMTRITDEATSSFFRHLQDTMDDTKKLMESIISGERDPEAPRTLAHNILESKLPSSEKTFKRVYEEISTVTGAGFETTASALRLIFFHVFSTPKILQRLRAELASARVGSESELELKALEQLPFVTATIMEGLRLSPAIATRMARVAPDRDIFYEQWRIPAGTPIGMTLILMHTDEKTYKDSKSFDPERWMNPEARKTAEKAFAPFARGTRVCLGIHLAWADLYMVLAAVVQRFDFEFQGATAKDFECSSDQFAIGTAGRGILNAVVSNRSD